MLSVQSVILSPAKRGIVKELVGHGRLGFASGMMEIVVVLAICAGQIITGFWYTARLESGLDGWEAAMLPLQVITFASVVALAVSFIIQWMPVQGHRKFRLPILVEHFGQLGELWKERPLRLSAAGAAFFWGYAGYLNLAAINIAKQITGEGDQFAMESAILMLAASLGIVFGGAIASVICKRGIELGLVPIGGLVMVLGTLALAMTPQTSAWLKVWFVVAGAGGAILLVPLNAHLQDICPPGKRGKILAGLNLLDCIAGLLAVLIQLGLVALEVDFRWQFVGLAIVCVFATHYAARLLPQHVVRVIVLTLVRTFYRMKILHADRMPEKGGVLLTPNHVSYIDAFVLSAACPRKVRFLMFDEYFKHRWIGPFVRLFDTVPISNRRAKQALQVAADALKEGSVVCIFPEGQLARTGVMNEFKRGFEMIARKADCPVVPAVMDGLWGSIFSFERNKFNFKWPYRIPYGITVAFGEAVPAKEASAVKIRHQVQSLRAEAFEIRESIEKPESILSRKIRVLHGDVTCYRDAFEKIHTYPEEMRKQVVANALQIGEINAIRRRQTVMLEWDALEHCRDVLTLAFVQFFKLKVVLIDSQTGTDEIRRLSAKYDVEQYFSGDSLADRWLSAGLGGACYDFSGKPMQDERVFACLVRDKRVISMSMPHPSAITATNQHQDGYLLGAWGRLLPGYVAEEKDGELALKGAGLGDETLTLDGFALNLDAMVFATEDHQKDDSDYQES